MNVEQAEAALARAIRELDEARLVVENAAKRAAYWADLRDRAALNVYHAGVMVDERTRVLRDARLAEDGGWHPEPTEQEKP